LLNDPPLAYPPESVAGRSKGFRWLAAPGLRAGLHRAAIAAASLALVLGTLWAEAAAGRQLNGSAHLPSRTASWVVSPIGGTPTLRGVAAASANVIWAVGDHTLLTSMDGGRSWADRLPNRPGLRTINGVSAASETTGWAVGEYYSESGTGRYEDGATIFKTSDAGVTWHLDEYVQNARREAFSAVAAASPTAAWAVAGDGSIMATRDGTTWREQRPASAGSRLTSVAAASSTTAWAVGWDSVLRTTILATTDGGDTWVPQRTEAFDGLSAVAALSTTTAWAVGPYGLILGTLDGGATWNRWRASCAGDLVAVTTTSPSDVRVVDATGRVLSSSNFGRTWTYEAVTDDPAVMKLSPNIRAAATAGSTTWIVGDKGLILVDRSRPSAAPSTGTTRYFLPLAPVHAGADALQCV
jgi:photosystem II stability/assembly factor-like uncharacterized protein